MVGCADEIVVPIDSALNARSIRQDTAELASYLLSDGQGQPPQSLLGHSRSSVRDIFDADHGDLDSTDDVSRNPETIPERHEPPSAEASDGQSDPEDGPSVLSNLLRRSPPDTETRASPNHSGSSSGESDTEETPLAPVESLQPQRSVEQVLATEHTPLLRRTTSRGEHEYAVDVESQKERSAKRWLSGLVETGHKVEGQVAHAFAVAVNPKRWDWKAMLQTAVITPASCLPAVSVGLLLNMLDALSYGMFISTAICRYQLTH